MKKDIAEYIAKCLECQRVKAEHMHPDGLLEPLPIPEWKWEVVTMDFIIGLPRTNKKHMIPSWWWWISLPKMPILFH
jgi:hypothetical protein